MVRRIAYVTNYDVLDSSKWPKHRVGTCSAGYYIARSIENKSILVDYISTTFEEKYNWINKFKKKCYRIVFKKLYDPKANPLIVKHNASQISTKLSKFNSDIVLCPESMLEIAYLECKQPIAVWTDTSIASLIDFYPWFSNFCNETKKNIYTIEKAALHRCKLIIFSSDWAAQSAIATYGIQPSKIKVVPLGATIECNRTNEDINSIVESRNTNLCKLLFVGVDWFRKGGNIALEVAKELNRMGLKTELLVAGCQPITNEPLPSFVTTLGFINKSTHQGLEKMNKLFCESHFFIMPSKAETYGLVFCEANSFGTPCLATDVGGIPTIIKDGLNGKTFSLKASISEYCNYILSLMANYSEYKKLALSSFNEYQSRLNWGVAAQTAKQLIMDMV